MICNESGETFLAEANMEQSRGIVMACRRCIAQYGLAEITIEHQLPFPRGGGDLQPPAVSGQTLNTLSNCGAFGLTISF